MHFLKTHCEKFKIQKGISLNTLRSHTLSQFSFLTPILPRRDRNLESFALFKLTYNYWIPIDYY